MKAIAIMTIVASLMTSGAAFGQKKEMNLLLGSYYEVKNALVASDSKTAGQKANEFLSGLTSFPADKLTAEQRKSWNSHLSRLKKEATQIGSSSDLDKQRDHFKEFSTQFYAVLKVMKMNEQHVYQQYCPMKKAYWLSSEKEIRNPYYGSKMLSCGSIKETLN